MTAALRLEEEPVTGASARRGRRVRRVAAVVLLPLIAASPWWGRAVARRMGFFRVRHVEVVGVRYLPAADVIQRLRLDTSASVWDDRTPLEARVAGHPQVAAVSVERRLPGTLVVRVTENPPIVLAPGARGGLVAFDARGRLLPFDPSDGAPDLPVVSRPDPDLLRILADLRMRAPSLYARVSEARRTGRDEVVLSVPPLLVRARTDLTAARASDILPVEADLRRRQAHVAELDLRFRDQVIARLQ